MRLARTLAIALPVLLLAHFGSGTALAEQVAGPRSARPGTIVTFWGYGYGPYADIRVDFIPRRTYGGNCCGTFIRRTFHANSRGRVRLRFRWPRRYEACFMGHAFPCEHPRWRRGEWVYMLVHTVEYGRSDRKAVRIRGY